MSTSTATSAATSTGIAQYKEMCEALGIAMLANVPALLVGDPGEGKSSAVYKIGGDTGLNVQALIASLYDPTEFNGMPFIDPNGGGVKRDPLAWVKEVIRLKEEEGKDSIVFYDELTTAAPTVQAALLRLILEGVSGDVQMPEGTRSIAAANPPHVAADGWTLSAPLANRFFHLPWKLPVEVVVQGFTIGWPTFEVPQVDEKDVLREFGQAKGFVGAFLKRFPNQVSNLPTDATKAGGPWPSPRSWEMAAKLYGTAVAAGCNSAVKSKLVVGCVGDGAGHAFMEFADHQDLPDPEDLLNDPASWEVPSRQDKVYIIASSVWSATLSNLTKQRWEACGEILSKIAETSFADIAIFYGGYWAGTDQNGDNYRPEGAYPSPHVAETLLPVLGELGRLLPRR